MSYKIMIHHDPIAVRYPAIEINGWETIDEADTEREALLLAGKYMIQYGEDRGKCVVEVRQPIGGLAKWFGHEPGLL
jgi:hypothetical protein